MLISLISTLFCTPHMNYMGLNISSESRRSCCSSVLKNLFTGFASVLVHLSVWATFRGVLNIGLRGPTSRAPKSIIIQIFSQFPKYFPLASHHSCPTCLCGVLFVFQWCVPKAVFLGLRLRLQQSLLGHQASCFQMFLRYILEISYMHLVGCMTYICIYDLIKVMF